MLLITSIADSEHLSISFSTTLFNINHFNWLECKSRLIMAPTPCVHFLWQDAWLFFCLYSQQSHLHVYNAPKSFRGDQHGLLWQLHEVASSNLCQQPRAVFVLPHFSRQSSDKNIKLKLLIYVPSMKIGLHGMKISCCIVSLS